MKITITLTKGQLTSIAKQASSLQDSEAVEVEVVEAPTPTPSKTAPLWQSKIAKKVNPAEYKAANQHANKVINNFVGQARKALKDSDEKALVESLKNAHGVCRSRVEAGAVSFALMADNLEARVAQA